MVFHDLLHGIYLGGIHIMAIDYLVVGAGLYGSTIAHALTKAGKKVLVIEKENHVAGICHQEKEEDIFVHTHGAHIFHTSDEEVWNLVTSLTPFTPYINSPKACYHGKLYSMPFNMNTYHEIWPEVVTEEDAKKKLEEECAPYQNIDQSNVEGWCLSHIGPTLYERLVKHYTEKQWEKPCKELDASIIKRLPLRFTYDSNYFNDTYQGLPIKGYDALAEALLEGSEVLFQEDFLKNQEKWKGIAGKIIYSGPLDALFSYRYGALGWRTLRFEKVVLDQEDYQGMAVVNYTDDTAKYTRIVEHKHFLKDHSSKTIITREYSSNWTKGREALYPLKDEENSLLAERYKKEAEKEGIFLGGRLGIYRYLDMDDVIRLALDDAKLLLSQTK